ncbi:FAD-binding oxidoreductase [Rheinheimera texasensis]|uniref:FAD-binding oxidoreductase n=1 Tax=Rheinheimera texasensis TaxID=306205 RepID=UPI0032B1C138
MSFLHNKHDTYLPFGLGRSYGDSCLAQSGQVIQLSGMDRFISADWSQGILQAEAGVTLAQILSVAIPHGWFLPVTPGTRFVTLAGAIANDVHGKNHHRVGTFGRFVRSLELCRSDGSVSQLSAAQHPELFSATIGGLGLTGVISRAELQLQRIAGTDLQVRTERFGHLQDFFSLSAFSERQHEFCVAWIDCTARDNQLGRGVMYSADFAPQSGLKIAAAGQVKLPFTPPVSLVNSLSLKLFNELYWRKTPVVAHMAVQSYQHFFYPLDGILNWNRLYGRGGFQQYQAVVPQHCASDAIHDMLAIIAATGTGSALAVLKRCGDIVSPGILSFPCAGTTLALDFPQNDATAALFQQLDAVVRAAGGRLYPAKDAHMSADDFQRGYPNWGGVEKWRDPALMSRFWHRVTQ